MLSEALRQIRLFHNVSAEQLADSLGYSKSYISEIERGKKRINIDVIESYSKFFKLAVSEIFLLAEALDEGVEPKRNKKAHRLVKRIVDWIADETQ